MKFIRRIRLLEKLSAPNIAGIRANARAASKREARLAAQKKDSEEREQYYAERERREKRDAPENAGPAGLPTPGEKAPAAQRSMVPGRGIDQVRAEHQQVRDKMNQDPAPKDPAPKDPAPKASGATANQAALSAQARYPLPLGDRSTWEKFRGTVFKSKADSKKALQGPPGAKTLALSNRKEAILKAGRGNVSPRNAAAMAADPDNVKFREESSLGIGSRITGGKKRSLKRAARDVVKGLTHEKMTKQRLVDTMAGLQPGQRSGVDAVLKKGKGLGLTDIGPMKQLKKKKDQSGYRQKIEGGGVTPLAQHRLGALPAPSQPPRLNKPSGVKVPGAASNGGMGSAAPSSPAAVPGREGMSRQGPWRDNYVGGNFGSNIASGKPQAAAAAPGKAGKTFSPNRKRNPGFGPKRQHRAALRAARTGIPNTGQAGTPAAPRGVKLMQAHRAKLRAARANASAPKPAPKTGPGRSLYFGGASGSALDRFAQRGQASQSRPQRLRWAEQNEQRSPAAPSPQAGQRSPAARKDTVVTVPKLGPPPARPRKDSVVTVPNLRLKAAKRSFDRFKARSVKRQAPYPGTPSSQPSSTNRASSALNRLRGF